MRPHLRSPAGSRSGVQERHGPVRLSAEEMIRGLQQASYEDKLERARAVQLGEEEALGRSHCGLTALKDGL